MSDPVVILLPLPTSVNAMFADGRTRRVQSKKYKAWITEAGWDLARQRPCKCPGRVALLIEVREPPTRRAEDLDNRTKAVLDLLVEHRVIADDSQHIIRRIVLEWSGQVEGVRITIEPWEK